MSTSDLDQEYSQKAAEHARARQARQKQAQQRRVVNQGRALGAEPIAEADDLAAAVARLAGAWGLKKKASKR